ncbi:tail length tape measure protein [Gordonia phage Gsput1]|uniref:Tape measure protein n=1 Tax=Gordonia phage Gsput1 TaxID=1622193 RepID=A0A0E3XB61_9CAUD|nr:tail length tape measure protein [Gordonia phage Gsput1]AKC03043.1 tape measure protein [Gordonia phage Gsput1]
MADDDAIWVPVLPSMREFAKEYASGLTSATKQGRATMDKAGQEAGDAYAKGLAKAQKSVDRATSALSRSRDREADAAGKVRVAEQQLQSLRDKGVTDSGRLAAAEEKINSARRKHESASRMTGQAEKALADAEKEQTSAADKSAKATREAGDSIEVMGTNAGLTAGHMKAFAAVAVTAAAGAGAALFALGSDFTNMKNTIRVGTGATGAALNGMVESAKNLGSQVPASFDEIGSTVADLNTRLGLTGEPLERLSRQFLELQNMGIDADINTVSQAFSGFGIKGAETESALDDLFRVSQATGLSVNDLAQSAVKAGPQLRQFGFGLKDSAALAGQLDKSGLDADRTLQTMSRALVAFAKDGKKPKEALFGTITEIENLTKAGNDAAALDMAGKIFGTRGAGQFVDAVKAGTLSVSDFMGATGATGDTIIGVADETRTFSEQWQMFKNDVLAQLEPIATRVFGVITSGMGWLATNGVPALRSFGEFLSDNKTTLAIVGGVMLATVTPALTVMTIAWTKAQIEAAKSAAAQLVSSYKTVGGWVAQGAAATTGAATTVAGWASTAAKAVWSAGVQSVQGAKVAAGWVAQGAAATVSAGIQAGAWIAAQAGAAAAAVKTLAYNGVMLVVRGATMAWTAAQWLLNVALNANPISLIVIGIGLLVAAIVWVATKTTWFQTAWQVVWNAVKAAWDWVWNALKAGFEALVNFFTKTIPDAATKAKDWIVEKWNALLDFFKGLPAKMASAVSSLWDGLKNGFRGALNWIIDAWNNFSITITLPKILGGKSLTIDTPNLPRLADGGRAGRRDDGRLFGPGTGRSDSILGVGLDGMPTALVSNGEFVVNEKSTRRFLPLLRMLNAGGAAARSVANLFRGDYDGELSRHGIEEDNAGVGAVLDASVGARSLRNLLGGDFDGGLTRFGIEEDSPIVNALIGRLPRFADGGLATGTSQLRDAISERFGITDIGGYRPEDGYGEHSTGRALDVMVGGDSAKGDQVKDFAVQNADAIGLKWAIWQQKMWYPDGSSEAMPDRGSPTQNHMDHVHIFSDESISGGLKGSLTGGDAKGDATATGNLGDSAGLDSSGASTSGGFAGANIGGGTSSFGNSGGASKFGSAEEANKAGVVPVWVENWPGSVDGANGSDSSASGALTADAGTSGATSGGGDAVTATMPGTSGQASTGDPTKDAVRKAFAEHDPTWAEGDMWAAVDWIVGKESTWNPTARNPESGAFGLFQFLGSTKDQYLPDESADSYTQGKAGAKYIADRYGDPLKAKAFWEANGWYDDGGLATNKGLMLKNVNQPERVLSPDQTKAFDKLVEWLTGVDLDEVRGSMTSGEAYAPEDGSWFDDPQANALDALFEVLDVKDVVTADDVLPDKATRYGVAGSAHSAPVRNQGAGNGEAVEKKVVGTEVHGDVHVTDYEGFRSRQERDEKLAHTKAGV